MNRRVLVVDDEPDIREIARIALGHVAGWTVLLAEGGLEAIRIAIEEQPDAILVDMMMPEVDGAETVRRLAADPRTAGIPVLLLTAKVLSGDQTALTDTPVAALLGKPFNPMTLAAQVADVLGWASDDHS